jgi:hypothetical protein
MYGLRALIGPHVVVPGSVLAVSQTVDKTAVRIVGCMFAGAQRFAAAKGTTIASRSFLERAKEEMLHVAIDVKYKNDDYAGIVHIECPGRNRIISIPE